MFDNNLKIQEEKSQIDFLCYNNDKNKNNKEINNSDDEFMKVDTSMRVLRFENQQFVILLFVYKNKITNHMNNFINFYLDTKYIIQVHKFILFYNEIFEKIIFDFFFFFFKVCM